MRTRVLFENKNPNTHAEQNHNQKGISRVDSVEKISWTHFCFSNFANCQEINKLSVTVKFESTVTRLVYQRIVWAFRLPIGFGQGLIYFFPGGI